MKRLNVSVDDDLHKELKVAVASEATTIANFVVEAIKEKIQKEADKKEA